MKTIAKRIRSRSEDIAKGEISRCVKKSLIEVIKSLIEFGKSALPACPVA